MADLSQYQLGIVLNVDARTIRRWEAGDVPVNSVADRAVGWLLQGLEPPELRLIRRGTGRGAALIR